MTLREHHVEQIASLPDGGAVTVRVCVPDDPYIGRKSDTVAVELVVGEETVASVNSVLDANQTSEARELAREIVAGLESGELAVTAAAIEPLAAQPR